MVVKFFLGYLLAGQVINWGTVFFVTWSVLRKCRGRDDILAELNAEDRRTVSYPEWGPDPVSKLHCLWRIVFTAVLWPRNVVNMLYLRSDQLKMADTLLQARPN